MTTRKKIMLGALVLLLLVLTVLVIHYRRAISHYVSHELSHDDKLHLIRNFEVMSKHKGQSIGFDVSQYQGVIRWSQTDSVEGAFPLDFVFIRATAGRDLVDKYFHQNWQLAKNRPLIRGAYHYYRPDENSVEQAYNFIRTVKLEKGDFPPVLDIEQLPENQTLDSLKKGLKRWLWLVEKHYKVRPIIYSGDRFYNDFLREDFPDYPAWIANYNFFVENMNDGWSFWQFTDRGFVKGIDADVDLNLYQGSRADLDKLRIK